MTPRPDFNQRPAVLLYGYYGAGNLGDDLLLAVLVGELRGIVPGAEFLVLDHGETAGLTLGADVSFTHSETILAQAGQSRLARLFDYLRGYSRHLRRGRWLIFGGGTLFHQRGSLTSLMLQCLICLMARACGVRIVALGVGVADLPTASARWLLRRIVGMSYLFLVRDEAALRQCAGTAARLTDDLAFAWPAIAPTASRPRAEGPLRIGLTVYPPACRGPGGEHVTAALAAAIARWQMQGHAVAFLVCQTAGAVIGDEAVFAEMRAALGPAGANIETRTLRADAKIIATGLADLDAFAGMRYHALVLAAMLERPFIGIAHDNKISEICRRFSMPCITVADLNGLDRAFNVLPTLHIDTRLLAESRRAAQDNFRLFAAALVNDHKHASAEMAPGP